MSNYPGDERIYELMIERFVTRDERRALFASYLAKLGDERAIPMLKEAAQSPDINYLDYVEVVNAIEALGGERPPEREFLATRIMNLSGRCNGLNAHVLPLKEELLS